MVGPTAVTVWSHADMRIVLPARAISALGDSVTLVALSVRIAQSAQPAQMTALLVAFATPVFALSGVAGRLVDAHDSRRLLVAAGLVQVAGSLGLVWGPNFGAVLAFVVLLQIGQAVTGPTWGALIPRIVEQQLVGKAVGLQQSATAAAALVGTGLAGVLYDKLGYHWTIAVDTLTFAALVLAACAVQTRRGGVAAQPLGGPDHACDPGDAVSTGLGHIRRDQLLRLLVPALWIFVLAAEGTNVVEPFLVTRELHASATTFGLVTLSFAAGVMVGPLAAGRVTDETRQVRTLALAAAGMGVLFALIGLAPSVWALTALYVLAGVSNGILNALCFTIVTLRTPDQFRGRVLASLNGSARAFSVLALLLGGLAGQSLGTRATFVVSGCITFLTAALIVISQRGISQPGEPSRGFRLRSAIRRMWCRHPRRRAAG